MILKTETDEPTLVQTVIAHMKRSPSIWMTGAKMQAKPGLICDPICCSATVFVLLLLHLKHFRKAIAETFLGCFKESHVHFFCSGICWLTKLWHANTANWFAAALANVRKRI